jgi:hypothetical protein
MVQDTEKNTNYSLNSYAFIVLIEVSFIPVPEVTADTDITLFRRNIRIYVMWSSG